MGPEHCYLGMNYWVKIRADSRACHTRCYWTSEPIYDWLSSKETIGVINRWKYGSWEKLKITVFGSKAPVCLEFWFLTGLQENVLKLFSRLSFHEWDIRCGVVFDDPPVFLKNKVPKGSIVTLKKSSIMERSLAYIVIKTNHNMKIWQF